jgi:polar amino acid transport system substrate-binding protein
VDRIRLLAIGAVVVVLLGGLALALLLIGCGDDGATNPAAGDFTPLHDGVLTVATELPAPGFWDGGGADGTDPDHLTGGFEYDLAHELADKLGLDRVEVVDVPFDRLVGGQARGFDLALAQVSITRRRSRHVAFSVPYLTTPVGVAGRADLDVPDLAEARTLRWGVAEGTTEVDVLDDLVRPDDEPKVYPTVAAALAAVTRGEVDVAAADYFEVLAAAAAAGKPEVRDDAPAAPVGAAPEAPRRLTCSAALPARTTVSCARPRLTLVAQITAPQHYGVVLPKGSVGSGNVEAVDSALRALDADRTLRRLRQRLYDRFQVDPDDVPTIEVTP